MIDRNAKRSVSRQAIVLGISRGAAYYEPRPVSDADLKLMHRIDKLHSEFLFAGSRMLQGLLVQEGFKVGRLHVATLMKRMSIEALYRKPNTSKPALGHKIYPYLLGNLPVTRPNQVWAMDITVRHLSRTGGVRYLTPHGPRHHLSRRCGRLVHSAGPGLAGVDHARGRFLRGGCRRGAGRPRDQDQHGWQGCLARQPSGIPSDRWQSRPRSSSVCGGPSNTRKFTCGPMPVSQKPAPRSAGIWTSITHAVPIHRMTGKPPIRPTSTSPNRRRWQRNQGGKPLRNRTEPVQINQTTSPRHTGRLAHGL